MSEPGTENTRVTVQDLDGLVAQMAALKAEIKKEEDATAEKNKQLGQLTAKATGYLRELGRKNYASPHGTVSIVSQWRVKLPTEVSDKHALFDWLRERGLYDQYVSVNSNSLNSLFLAEWEVAKKSGQGVDFKIPGVGEPTLFERLSLTKGKSADDTE